VGGFVAADVAIDIGARLRPITAAIRRSDVERADQIYRAAKSLALNVAEGGRRYGKDRSYHFRIAAGSAAEIQAALRFAIAWEFCPAQPELLALIHRQLGLLWTLANPAERRSRA
jgi:four helix bundle protein